MTDKHPENVPARKCLDCGIRFENPGEYMGTWFSCETCGAIHVLVHGKWMLEDEAQPVLDLEAELRSL
jgi:hypothetical protein